MVSCFFIGPILLKIKKLEEVIQWGGFAGPPLYISQKERKERDCDERTI